MAPQTQYTNHGWLVLSGHYRELAIIALVAAVLDYSGQYLYHSTIIPRSLDDTYMLSSGVDERVSYPKLSEGKWGYPFTPYIDCRATLSAKYWEVKNND